MTDRYNVAVVGATGAVGETMLSILAARNFPVGQIAALASSRSAGTEVAFGNRSLEVRDLADFDFADTDIALFSAGGSISAEHAPRAAAAGCVVIDNTSHFRNDEDIPLVVPEVNAHAIAGYTQRGIIANPNCSTIQMVVALAPIHRAAGISRINVATYQSVSGAGRGAIEELARQSADRFNFREPEARRLGQTIAFNVIPHIDALEENGYTREEMKMVNETRRLLDDEAIAVNATAVRVPVFHGHGEAVHIETRTDIDIDAVRGLLRDAPGVELVEATDEAGQPTPSATAAGHDPVYVGRLRRDISHPRGISLWVVADNLRKGAALNAVQIAGILLARWQRDGRDPA